MGKPIRILVIDDHALFRESLVRLLGCEPDFQVVAQCDSVTQALDLLSRNAVDLILLDYELGEESGATLLRQLTRRNQPLKVLVVTGGISDAQTLDIFARGVSGVFLKHNDPGRLLEAIRWISQGEIWLDDSALRAVLAGSRTQAEPATREKALDLRQQQVLSAILDGLSNKEIAWNLKVSTSTIKVAIQELFEKTGVRSRSQLVRVVLENRQAGWLGGLEDRQDRL